MVAKGTARVGGGKKKRSEDHLAKGTFSHAGNLEESCLMSRTFLRALPLGRGEAQRGRAKKGKGKPTSKRRRRGKEAKFLST